MNALPALGLYVHIPFCERKCPYCDFNTYAGLQASFQDLVDALCGEMARWRAPLAGRTMATIFVGGGTPTVLTAAQLEQIFGAIHANFHVTAAAEITCEANPGTVDRDKFRVLRRLGVNRLSMGVQSFQPDELAFLGRIHDVEDVYLAYDAARAAGLRQHQPGLHLRAAAAAAGRLGRHAD
jgi:oxygen-independent coproporphyrinogen-3 oxidase